MVYPVQSSVIGLEREGGREGGRGREGGGREGGREGGHYLEP